jgi:hypothetical protein
MLSKDNTNTTTMASTARNGPLALHIDVNYSSHPRRIDRIQCPDQAHMLFSGMIWSKSLKTLWWCSNDGNESHLAIGAFWGL